MEIACDASPELESEPAELAGLGRRASRTVTAATARASLFTVTGLESFSREEFGVILNGWMGYCNGKRERGTNMNGFVY